MFLHCITLKSSAISFAVSCQKKPITFFLYFSPLKIVPSFCACFCVFAPRNEEKMMTRAIAIWYWRYLPRSEKEPTAIFFFCLSFFPLPKRGTQFVTVAMFQMGNSVIKFLFKSESLKSLSLSGCLIIAHFVWKSDFPHYLICHPIPQMSKIMVGRRLLESSISQKAFMDFKKNFNFKPNRHNELKPEGKLFSTFRNQSPKQDSVALPIFSNTATRGVNVRESSIQ